MLQTSIVMKKKLVIEVDGDYHLEKEQQEQDQKVLGSK